MTASKEHYLSNVKTCDGKIAKDSGTWLKDVSRISAVSCKDPDSVASATSKGSLHKYVRELHSAGKNQPVMKTLLQETFSECGNSTVAKQRITTFKQSELPMHEYISKFTYLVQHAHNSQPSDTTRTIWHQILLKTSQTPILKTNLGPVRLVMYRTSLHLTSKKTKKKQKIRALDF